MEREFSPDHTDPFHFLPVKCLDSGAAQSAGLREGRLPSQGRAQLPDGSTATQLCCQNWFCEPSLPDLQENNCSRKTT